MAEKNTTRFVGKMKAEDLAELIGPIARPLKPFNYREQPSEPCPGPWSDAALDKELARRAQSPPSWNQFIREAEFREALEAEGIQMQLEGDETVSIDALRVELAATPADHVMREWREWELALAERAMLMSGATTFYRVVAVDDEGGA
jgi:hypothetical protein